MCTVVVETKDETGYWPKYYYGYGLYDSTGKIITDATWRILGDSTKSRYDDWGDSNSANAEVPNFSDGKIRVMNQDEQWGSLDLQGNIVGEVRWSEIGDFREGMAAVSDNGKYGYIDPNGQVIIQPQYSAARVFSEGQAWVKTSNDLWQCIDASNNVIIPAQYSNVTEFKNGLADVELPNVGWQIIDAKGELVYFKTN